uniref:membrane-spanning 4-domains subfamily A member 14-like isoform X5 n=1 Tax=Panthera onca TaxID=9690 RepID=UPI0029558560|nr:membrane-spanning 4-domains subfamily A member 14-like isoform X5 [Panthera onca]
MPRRRLWIREETRLLGAIQIMTGLIVHFVGQLWTYLFTTQVIAFGKAYLPLVVITRYTYWSSVCFLFSGVFAVLTERMRSTFLMSYTIAVNIRSGKILSEYLFLFTILELFTACTVAHWIYKAKHLR